MGRHWFRTDEAYADYVELVMKERPDLFDRSRAFGKPDLFPPVDPISLFAEEWKRTKPLPP
jgi:hypothetical protein